MEHNNNLVRASLDGNILLVKDALKKGADNYDTPMALAARGGHIDIVQLLLEKGANSYSWSLSEAAFNGHIDIVRLMLESGAKNHDVHEYTQNKDILSLVKQCKDGKVKIN